MQTNPDISSVFNPIEDAINSIMKSFGLSGLAVGVVKQDEVAYTKLKKIYFNHWRWRTAPFSSRKYLLSWGQPLIEERLPA